MLFTRSRSYDLPINISDIVPLNNRKPEEARLVTRMTTVPQLTAISAFDIKELLHSNVGPKARFSDCKKYSNYW